MELQERKPSGREKDQESVQLLNKLREKLYSDNISAARRASFNLSWMQEDGLDILKEALFGRSPRFTKTAATYGLRKMVGRMRKLALETLHQGLKSDEKNVAEVCTNALLLLEQGKHQKPYTKREYKKRPRMQIRDISYNRRPRPQRGPRDQHPRNQRPHGNRRVP